MQKILGFIKQKTLISNTIIMLITSFLIKFLGLVYKIIITRILGTKGMELYVLIFPTLLLFTSISGFSLNLTVTKLVADACETRKYSPKKLIKYAIKISLIVSTITLFIFIISNKFLINYLLKNSSLFIPSLAIIPLIYLVGISDSLRGYFNGIKEVTISSLSILIEQLSRISGSIFLIIIFKNYSIEQRVFFCLLGQSIGEIGSIIYTSIKIKNITDNNSKNEEKKAIIKMALPLTLSKLIGNFTFFLEPIIYTSFFLLLDYNYELIKTEYTIINAYIIPLLTLSSFFSIALSNSIIPYVSAAFANLNYPKLNFYFQKIIIYSLIPGIFISIILYFYPDKLMYAFYGTTLGSTEIKKVVFLFLIYYIHLPIGSFLQAIGKNKYLMLRSTFFNFLRLLLICLLGFLSIFKLNSLLYSIIITIILSAIVDLICLYRTIKINFSFNKIFWLFILGILVYFICILFKFLNLPFYLSILFLLVIYLVFLKSLNILKN